MFLPFIIIILLLLSYFIGGNSVKYKQIQHSKKKLRFSNIRKQRYIDKEGKIYDTVGKLDEGSDWTKKY